MVKKQFLRPTTEFTVRCVRWDFDIVKRHTDAGFEDVPRGEIIRQFWYLLDFLQSNHLTVALVARTLDEMSNETKLTNSHLTDDRYYFLQKYEGRYMNRLRKRDSEKKAGAFLSKWFKEYKDSSQPPLC